MKELAVRTLPWVTEAHEAGGSEWDRAHRVRRALRGCGGSPGFVEDWLLAGAIDAADIARLVERIIASGRVRLSHLCAPCQYYQGPQPWSQNRADCSA